MANWFEKAWEKLNDLKDYVGLGPSLDKAAERAMNTIMQEIIARQPHGHIEMIYGVKPSERMDHTAIADGWVRNIDIYEDQGTARLSIGNRSEHIEHILFGAPRHPIPLSPGYLYFWWGEPHRWEAKDGLEPGPRQFTIVDHPGITPDNFVEDAVYATLDDVDFFIREAMLEWTGNIYRGRQ